MTHLKVFWPDGPRQPQPLTLMEAFQKEILPRKSFWDGRTIAEYSCTLNLWAGLTGDPPLHTIDEKLIARFSAELLRRPGKRAGETLSRNTIRKHLRHLKALLRLLGPRTMRGIGLLHEIPLIESPRPA